MPVSPSDVAFLNRQIERHLRRQESWSWIRWVLLLLGLLMCLFAWWLFTVVPSPDEIANRRTVRVSQTGPASTEPVTQTQLLTVVQASDSKSEGDSLEAMRLAEARWMCLGLSAVNWLLGCYLIAGTVTRWNRHRLDAIVIELLREKCKDVLRPDSTAT